MLAGAFRGSIPQDATAVQWFKIDLAVALEVRFLQLILIVFIDP